MPLIHKTIEVFEVDSFKNFNNREIIVLIGESWSKAERLFLNLSMNHASRYSVSLLKDLFFTFNAKRLVC